MPWPTKKLGEICDFQNGLWKGKIPPFKKVKVLRNTNFLNGGYLDLSNVAEIEVEENQLIDRVLQKGDLILERSGGGPTQPVGRVVYFNIDGKFSFSNFTTRIRVKNYKEIYPKYLWLYLNMLYIFGTTENLQKQTTGIRNLIFSEYKNLPIPLPALSVQKQIVEKIEKLFSKIDEAEKLLKESLDASSILFNSALQKVFKRGEKEGWEVRKLGEVSKIFAGSSAPQNVKYFENGKYPFVRVSDLSGFKITKLNKTRDYVNEFAIKELKLIKAKKNTILFPKSGAAILTNTRAILDIDAYIVSHLAAIESNERYVLSFYVFFFLYSFDMGGLVNDPSYPALKLNDISDIQIPLPPLSEQKKIVEYLDGLREKVEELKRLQEEQLKSLEELRKAILKKAFFEFK